MDDDVREYIEAIEPAHKPLFDRVHGLIVELYPDLRTMLSYKMPTYVVGEHRVYVAMWKHGLSLYGWHADDDGGFVARHPELIGSKGTIKLRPADAAGISDDELRSLLKASLGG